MAAELAGRKPATMVAASHDPALAQAVQDLFRVPWLRIYRHNDPLGVELAGATKNVIALAAGMVDGLEAGDNAKSALLASHTRQGRAASTGYTSVAHRWRFSQ